MELHQYQKNIANFIAMHDNCILSVDMGLGKTASVLSWLEWKKPATCLIVAPKRVTETVWRQEAEKWNYRYSADRMVVVSGTTKKRAAALKDVGKPYKIISRDNLSDVKDSRFDVLIIDELTSFKTPTSARSKLLKSIISPIRIGLTGTFLANGAIDIFGQAAAVDLDKRYNEANFYAWRATYFRDVLRGSGLAFSKWKLNVPLELLLAPIKDCIYTLTAEDYLTIPAKTERIIRIDLDESTKVSIDELNAFLSTKIGNKVLTFDEKQKFAKLQTLCNGFVYDKNGEAHRGAVSCKLERVADFVADCKDAGEPVLLFYAYREEAIWLQQLLNERGVKCESVERKGFVDRWNAGEIECLFAHPASAGHGLNLQHGGRIIVWSTLTYNYELFAQGNARLARQGQKRNVQINYFLAGGTCEERVLNALINKQEEQNEFLKLTKQ